MKLLSVKKLSDIPVILEIKYKTGFWFWETIQTKQVFDKYPEYTRNRVCSENWDFLDGTDSILAGLYNIELQLSTINQILKVGETYFTE